MFDIESSVDKILSEIVLVSSCFSILLPSTTSSIHATVESKVLIAPLPKNGIINKINRKKKNFFIHLMIIKELYYKSFYCNRRVTILAFIYQWLQWLNHR